MTRPITVLSCCVVKPRTTGPTNSYVRFGRLTWHVSIAARAPQSAQSEHYTSRRSYGTAIQHPTHLQNSKMQSTVGKRQQKLRPCSPGKSSPCQGQYRTKRPLRLQQRFDNVSRVERRLGNAARGKISSQSKHNPRDRAGGDVSRIFAYFGMIPHRMI